MGWRDSSWFKFGIGFWTGALVYSLVNLIMNLKHAPNILTYNIIISAVAVFGIVFNMMMFNRRKQQDQKK